MSNTTKAGTNPETKEAGGNVADTAEPAVKLINGKIKITAKDKTMIETLEGMGYKRA